MKVSAPIIFSPHLHGLLKKKVSGNAAFLYMKLCGGRADMDYFINNPDIFFKYLFLYRQYAKFAKRTYWKNVALFVLSDNSGENIVPVVKDWHPKSISRNGFRLFQNTHEISEILHKATHSDLFFQDDSLEGLDNAFFKFFHVIFSRFCRTDAIFIGLTWPWLIMLKSERVLLILANMVRVLDIIGPEGRFPIEISVSNVKGERHPAVFTMRRAIANSEEAKQMFLANCSMLENLVAFHSGAIGNGAGFLPGFERMRFEHSNGFCNSGITEYRIMLRVDPKLGEDIPNFSIKNFFSD